MSKSSALINVHFHFNFYFSNLSRFYVSSQSINLVSLLGKMKLNFFDLSF
jgi:hypothetical protein